MREVRGGEDRLIHIVQGEEEVAPSIGVQFGKGFIQKQQRALTGAFFHPFDLGKFYGQQRGAHLPAGTVISQVYPIGEEPQLIPMGAAGRDPALDFLFSKNSKFFQETGFDFICNSSSSSALVGNGGGE